MVSVCRLPNAGKCWASNPRSRLPPAGLHWEPGAGRGCSGRAWYVCASCDNMCVVCACHWRVSVDTSNSMAQTSSLAADLRAPSGMKVDLNPIPRPALGFSLLPALRSGTRLRAWFVPVVARGGSVWPKEWAPERPFLSFSMLPRACRWQRSHQPLPLSRGSSGGMVAHIPLFLTPSLSPSVVWFFSPGGPASLTLGLPASLSSSPAGACIPSPFCGHHMPFLLFHTPSWLPQADRAREPSQPFQKGQGSPCNHPFIHTPCHQPPAQLGPPPP